MWGFRLTVAAAIGVLGTIVSGAFITSAKVALQSGQPEPGVGAHRIIALLAVGLACAALIAGTRSWRKRIAAASGLVSLIASASIGWRHPLSPGVAVWHAALSHLSTASLAVALIVPSAPNLQAIPLAVGPWTALRPAAVVTPIVVFAQIVMGALYRHQVTGIMPHMLGAMVVALLTMVVSVVVLQHFSESGALRQPATVLISAALLQICLGIAVFLMLLLNLSNTAAFVWIATAHVTTGTLVFAASILMAERAWRSLAPAKSAD